MTCPVCGERTVREYRPFCSRRCADLDLGKWLRGGYAIPTDESPEEGETAPAANDAIDREH